MKRKLIKLLLLVAQKLSKENRESLPRHTKSYMIYNPSSSFLNHPSSSFLNHLFLLFTASWPPSLQLKLLQALAVLCLRSRCGSHLLQCHHARPPQTSPYTKATNPLSFCIIYYPPGVCSFPFQNFSSMKIKTVHFYIPKLTVPGTLKEHTSLMHKLCNIQAT